jgi:hypothetical protein
MKKKSGFKKKIVRKLSRGLKLPATRAMPSGKEKKSRQKYDWRKELREMEEVNSNDRDKRRGN